MSRFKSRRHRSRRSTQNVTSNSESLEVRRLMTAQFGRLAHELDGEMQRLDMAVNAVQTVTRLPVVGSLFENSNQEFVDIDGAVRTQITDTLRGLPAGADASTVQHALASRLMANGYLGDHNGDKRIDARDVSVQVDHTTNDVDISLRLTKELTASAPRALDFDLGLDSVPLSLDSQGDLNLQVGIDYQNLAFGLDNNQFYFNTDSKEELQVHLAAQLSDNSLEGRIGFLEFSASQQDKPGAPQTEFAATFNIDVKPTTVDWSIDGTAEVHLDLYAGIAGMSQSAPSLGADLDFSWNFADVSQGRDILTITNAPSLQLNDVRVRLGQVLSDVVAPWLREVQKVTQPLQPVVDLLNTPIPGLTDLSNLVGGEDITLIRLGEMWGDYVSGSGFAWPDRNRAISEESVELLRTAITITNVVNAINQISVDAKNMEIPLGSYQIVGPNSRDIRVAAAATAEQVTRGIISELGFEELSKRSLYEVLDGVQGADRAAAQNLKRAAVTVTGDYNLQTPMFGAKPWVMMLLGQESDLIRLDADAQVTVPNQNIPFANFFGLEVGMNANLEFDAKLGIAYDTRGFLNANVVEGLYIDADSYAQFSGAASLYAGIDVGIASATVHGGLSTGGSKMKVEFADPNGDGKLRPSEISSLPFSELFVTSGRLTADAFVRAEIGVNVPIVGFVGVAKEFVFARQTIIDVSRDVRGGNPWVPNPNPSLAAANAAGELQLHTGPLSHLRNVAQSDTRERLRIEEIGRTAKGATIRVHGFGESEDFEGIQRIIGDLGSDDDVVQVDRSVTTEVRLRGGDGDDRIFSAGSGMNVFFGGAGNDRLEATTGEAHLYGDDGNDTLKLGSGRGSSAHGSAGNDTLYAGTAAAVLSGGDGNDTLFAGYDADSLYGGNGDDLFDLSAGQATVLPGVGNNRVIWSITDGNALLDAAGNTEIEVIGTTSADDITVQGTAPTSSHLHFGTITVDSSTTGRGLSVTLINHGQETEEELAQNNGAGVQTHLRIEGDQGEDQITVADMSGSGLTSLSANLAQLTEPEGDPDTITLHGSAQHDWLTVRQQEYYAWVQDGGSTHAEPAYGPLIAGGLMSVEGLNDYTAYVANSDDQLDIHLHEGSDTARVLGTTGPTMINAGAGDDHLVVLGNSAADFLGQVDFLGERDTNSVTVDLSTISAPITVSVDDTTIRGSIEGTGQNQTTVDYPFALSMSHVGGKPGSMTFRTGSNDDQVTLTGNTPGTSLDVNTGPGHDDVIIANGYFGAVNTSGITVNTGPGSDTVHAADADNDWRLTGSRSARLNGMPLNDAEHLHGGKRGDQFEFDNGVQWAGSLDGQGGRNALDYSAWSSGVSVNLPLGEASNVAGGGGKLIRNVQDFVGGQGDDLFVGDHQDNVISGGHGRDVLIGGAGRDRIDGGPGADLQIGDETRGDRDRTMLSDIAQRWAATADPSQLKHLVNSAFILDDGLLDSLFSDTKEDWLFS
jgi:Ca2+-binding RTX toxin-like protein